jgi:hypothetical protein
MNDPFHDVARPGLVEHVGCDGHGRNGAAKPVADAAVTLGSPDTMTSFPWEGLTWEARNSDDEGFEATAPDRDPEHFSSKLPPGDQSRM